MKKILLLAFIGIVLFALPSFSQENAKKITLEDIWSKGTFRPAYIKEIHSLKDGEHYSVLESNTIVKYSYQEGKKTDVIFDATSVKLANSKSLNIEDYQFNNDETKILISTNTEAIYRHSSIADFYVMDLKTKQITELSQGGKIHLAEFSPDGSKIAFARNNNLFIKNLADNKETQITNDGLINNIINGTTDWVYEEEFGFTKAFFWSPDGSKLAFYRFDESKVKEYTMTNWGDLYPEQYKYKYPKAGEDNSIVTIWKYDANSAKTSKMDIGNETNQYIPRIKWTEANNTLAILRMNRLQNKLEILLNNVVDGTSKVIYTEENKYYIDITDDLTFLSNNQFVITSEKDGYNHIYLYDFNGKLVKQITNGKWDVVSIKGVDEKSKCIFYISAESAPVNKDLYSVKLDGSKKTLLSTKAGSNDANFSATYKYYIGTYSDANTPSIYTINTSNGKEIKLLENNEKLAKAIQSFNFSKKEFATLTTENGITLNYWIIKPADFDANKKYPLFMYAYGGPGHNTVTNSYGYSDMSWFEMLTQKGYIVISVDNRGTAFRGEEFKKCTYKELGKFEVEDQINAAKFFGNLPYFDKNRIGIFGWSYGGYLSTLCMTKGADYFKAGIAVAPVTNWRYYDNIYTERFMRTPQENPSGYDDNSPINHVKKLKGKYLLVHGTGDDNVHVQNSMDLITALVNANKQFEMQLYPNKNHSIYGGFTRIHLYKRMTDFILNNL
ncbi:MAG: S9 family peptidase [Bacteroidetes bacterium]|nr:S9 family peptidase [Bacteroidota bacterium]